jgi:hypothetical protein
MTLEVRFTFVNTVMKRHVSVKEWNFLVTEQVTFFLYGRPYSVVICVHSGLSAESLAYEEFVYNGTFACTAYVIPRT